MTPNKQAYINTTPKIMNVPKNSISAHNEIFWNVG